jgi:glucose-6-phosphate isomerase
MQRTHLRKLFSADPDRFKKLSETFEDLLFDYSKNIINNKTLQLLFKLADECGIKDGIDAMFAGNKINESENRSVLHVALRNFSDRTYLSDGQDVMPEVEKVRQHMREFTEKVHFGRLERIHREKNKVHCKYRDWR